MAKRFIKGNVSAAEAAIAAGCRFYTGYPITPQSDIGETLALRLPEVGGIMLPAESEVAAANIIMGASLSGTRSLTSTSGPGFSLMAEAISMMAGGMNVPAVFINVARSGPGMGGIDACQMDYWFSVKAPGNSGARCFVMSPESVQEFVDQVYKAFDIADKYEQPVIVLTDAQIGQMMESVDMPEYIDPATLNRDKFNYTKRVSMDIKDRKLTQSLRMPEGGKTAPERQEELCIQLHEKYAVWERDEVAWEEYKLDDADVVLFAYGSVGRICKSAVDDLRAEGIKAGVFRPITLFPFPVQQTRNLDYSRIKHALCVELAIDGQMVEDVERSVQGKVTVNYYGRGGGMLIYPNDVVENVKKILRE